MHTDGSLRKGERGEEGVLLLDLPIYSSALQGPPIGIGTHGRVYRGVHKRTGRSVAIKKVACDFNSGVSVAALREISILKEIQSEDCIVRIHDGEAI